MDISDNPLTQSIDFSEFEDIKISTKKTAPFKIRNITTNKNFLYKIVGIVISLFMLIWISVKFSQISLQKLINIEEGKEVESEISEIEKFKKDLTFEQSNVSLLKEELININKQTLLFSESISKVKAEFSSLSNNKEQLYEIYNTANDTIMILQRKKDENNKGLAVLVKEYDKLMKEYSDSK